MTTKAFIFDMDGVIVDSERVWPPYEEELFVGLIGREAYQEIREELLGVAVKVIYQKLFKQGLNLSQEDFFAAYDRQAKQVYAQAKLTPGLTELLDFLVAEGWQLALVSSSRQNWIDQVLPRVGPEYFQTVLSVNDTPELRSKPEPDGYLEAMRQLGVTPENCVILEDSGKGIQAGKASGALTIGLLENHDDYWPPGADLYAQKLTDLTKLLTQFN